MQATDGTSRMSPRETARSWPVSPILLSSIVIALALSVFLLVRRATGELSTSLPGMQLIATAAIVCAWASLTAVLATEKLGRVTATLAPLCVLLIFAIGCSYPGSRLIDWFTWSTAVLVFAAVASNVRWRIAGRPRRPMGPGERGSPEIESEQSTDQMLQQVTRYRDADGCESIHAELVAEFTPGERQVTLFAAFCPPFERLPQVETNVADDSDATVKLAQVLHNGVQLEVRLAESAAEACTISIELYAAEAESG